MQDAQVRRLCIAISEHLFFPIRSDAVTSSSHGKGSQRPTPSTASPATSASPSVATAKSGLHDFTGACMAVAERAMTLYRLCHGRSNPIDIAPRGNGVGGGGGAPDDAAYCVCAALMALQPQVWAALVSRAKMRRAKAPAIRFVTSAAIAMVSVKEVERFYARSSHRCPGPMQHALPPPSSSTTTNVAEQRAPGPSPTDELSTVQADALAACFMFKSMTPAERQRYPQMFHVDASTAERDRDRLRTTVAGRRRSGTQLPHGVEERGSTSRGGVQSRSLEDGSRAPSEWSGPDDDNQNENSVSDSGELFTLSKDGEKLHESRRGHQEARRRSSSAASNMDILMHLYELALAPEEAAAPDIAKEQVGEKGGIVGVPSTAPDGEYGTSSSSLFASESGWSMVALAAATARTREQLHWLRLSALVHCPMHFCSSRSPALASRQPEGLQCAMRDHYSGPANLAGVAPFSVPGERLAGTMSFALTPSSMRTLVDGSWSVSSSEGLPSTQLDSANICSDVARKHAMDAAGRANKEDVPHANAAPWDLLCGCPDHLFSPSRLSATCLLPRPPSMVTDSFLWLRLVVCATWLLVYAETMINVAASTCVSDGEGASIGLTAEPSATTALGESNGTSPPIRSVAASPRIRAIITYCVRVVREAQKLSSRVSSGTLCCPVCDQLQKDYKPTLRWTTLDRDRAALREQMRIFFSNDVVEASAASSTVASATLGRSSGGHEAEQYCFMRESVASVEAAQTAWLAFFSATSATDGAAAPAHCGDGNLKSSRVTNEPDPDSSAFPSTFHASPAPGPATAAFAAGEGSVLFGALTQRIAATVDLLCYTGAHPLHIPQSSGAGRRRHQLMETSLPPSHRLQQEEAEKWGSIFCRCGWVRPSQLSHHNASTEVPVTHLDAPHAASHSSKSSNHAEDAAPTRIHRSSTGFRREMQTSTLGATIRSIVLGGCSPRRCALLLYPELFATAATTTSGVTETLDGQSHRDAPTASVLPGANTVGLDVTPDAKEAMPEKRRSASPANFRTPSAPPKSIPVSATPPPVDRFCTPVSQRRQRSRSTSLPLVQGELDQIAPPNSPYRSIGHPVSVTLPPAAVLTLETARRSEVPLSHSIAAGDDLRTPPQRRRLEDVTGTLMPMARADVMHRMGSAESSFTTLGASCDNKPNLDLDCCNDGQFVVGCARAAADLDECPQGNEVLRRMPSVAKATPPPGQVLLSSLHRSNSTEALQSAEKMDRACKQNRRAEKRRRALLGLLDFVPHLPVLREEDAVWECGRCFALFHQDCVAPMQRDLHQHIFLCHSCRLLCGPTRAVLQQMEELNTRNGQ